ncbi:MAG TPA: hypothetical protein VFE86_19360 [Ilumatobacteraceae bacterium]|nr:hypothetical protein [Ilumatobacteraceae bacterium]
MSALDWNALRAGGSVALVFAIPFSIAARVVAEGDGSDSTAALLSLAALVGFVLGAGVAAWTQQLQLPLKHGLICAVGTYVIAQAIFIVVRLLRGNEVHWLAALFNLTAAAVAGLIGGGLASLMHRRGFYPSSARRSS